MNKINEKLIQARKDAGYDTAADAARAMGVPEPTYSGHENGNRGFGRAKAVKYAKFFKVPVSRFVTGEDERPGTGHPGLIRLPIRGDVRAGAWLELDEFNDIPIRGYLDVVASQDFDETPQYALRVVGTSMNRVASDGDYAIVASWAETGLELDDDMLVVVQRQRGNTIEVTLKRAKRARKGWELWPDSDDPKYQEPLTMKDGEKDVTVSIIGLVLAIHRPIILRRRPRNR
jgi:SOS-response transcriptional repressor LexA